MSKDEVGVKSRKKKSFEMEYSPPPTVIESPEGTLGRGTKGVHEGEMENMERAIEGVDEGEDIPTDEELLLRMREQSEGFADLVRRGFEKMERDCGL